LLLGEELRNAAFKGDFEKIKKLLEEGVDVNAKDNVSIIINNKNIYNNSYNHHNLNLIT